MFKLVGTFLHANLNVCCVIIPIRLNVIQLLRWTRVHALQLVLFLCIAINIIGKEKNMRNSRKITPLWATEPSLTIIICMRHFKNILRGFLRVPLGTIRLFIAVLFKWLFLNKRQFTPDSQLEVLREMYFLFTSIIF